MIEVASSILGLLATAVAAVVWHLRGDMARRLEQTQRRLLLREEGEAREQRAVACAREEAHQRRCEANRLREQLANEQKQHAFAEQGYQSASQLRARAMEKEAQLRTQLGAVEAERDALKAWAGDCAPLMYEATQRLNGAAEAIRTLTGQRDAVAQERDQWLAEAHNVQEALDCANARLNGLCKERDELQQRNDTQKMMIENAWKEIESLRQMGANQAARHEQDKRDLETLAGDLAEAQEAVASLEKQLADARHEASSHARNLDRLAVELRSVRDERDRLGRVAGAALGLGTTSPAPDSTSILDAFGSAVRSRR